MFRQDDLIARILTEIRCDLAAFTFYAFFVAYHILRTRGFSHDNHRVFPSLLRSRYLGKSVG